MTYNILSNNASLVAVVGTKIYPEVAPSNTVAPYITYQEISNVPVNHKSGRSGSTYSRVQISIFTEKTADSKSAYYNGVTIAALVRTAMEAQKGTFAGVVVQSNISYEAEVNLNEDRSGYEGVNHRVQDYIINWLR